MKYTRYDLKKKNNNFMVFIIVIAVILILAFVCGTILSDIFLKRDNKSKKSTQEGNQSKVIDKKEENPNNKESEYTISDITSFSAIQCGVFTNKDNAQGLKVELSEFGKSFFVEDGNKIKVILGIYSEKEALTVIKKLENDGKEYSRKNFKSELKDSCDMQICEMVDANLQIIHKLYDDKVKSVHTKQIKEWAANLKEVDKNSSNYKVLLQIKDNINKLPEEISKNDIEKQNIFIYHVLNQLK
ncbi:SPOR domain-containing protein [Clostridium sp. ZS2-4]|uniref:SPOR domain-containing protein n=1 Tax=Clostridium sp. ZS2-4 TaxID=2987703 RepID=UPI00227D0FFD|nr:SPOR domain-containing protein [Clostridium sp. ZS2-4]MCY6354952.1 SPOR domain-containing protein [Clostridium sp. ZS2-4]